ncbi:MAG: peptidoglycan-binding domain-containing protein [Oscillospiraceae bacterium]|nr:peptidoglycan-binding domain-containing protein [Oscillospiraceae bacterium]
MIGSDPFLNQPVRSLQTMLNLLSFLEADIPGVVPDGIFGAATRKSVTAFQKSHGLSSTGIADEETFYAIVYAYDVALELLNPAASNVTLFPAGLVITAGQSHPAVFLVQGMLAVLSQVQPEFSPVTLNGIMDPATVQNILLLQELSLLRKTGNLEITTYNRLSQLYRSLFDRAALPSQG